MKLKINFEWRKKNEPDLDPEFLVKTALKAAGYTVGHIQIQGVWDEDKPATAQGPWDETRLPHEMVAKWVVDQDQQWPEYTCNTGDGSWIKAQATSTKLQAASAKL